MKLSFLGLIGLHLIIFTSAGTAQGDKFPLERALKQCRSQGQECFSKLESTLLKDAEPKARRDGDLLTVYIPYRGGLSYKNRDEDSEASATYRYLGFNYDLRYHLVGYYGYEWHYYYFVSYVTGNQFVLSALPRVSPDMNWIVTVAASESTSHGPNEIVVWRYIDGRLEQAFHHSPDEYALYQFVGWKSNTNIELKKFTVDDNNLCSEPHMTVSIDLTRSEADGWSFMGAPKENHVCGYDLNI